MSQFELSRTKDNVSFRGLIIKILVTEAVSSTEKSTDVERDEYDDSLVRNRYAAVASKNPETIIHFIYPFM